MRWKPRWWRWFVFFLNKHGKGSQVCENLHFSTFSIYVMAGLLTVAHKRHYQDMVSHKKDYITLLSTNWVQKYVLQLLMDKILWEARKVTWWKRSVIDDRIFLRQNTSIFVLASVAFVAIIDGLRFQVDPWVWHLVWWLVSSLFYHFHFPKGRSWTSPNKHSAVCCVDSHHY